MSVILQKDKATGETLVYETTNYRDKKTGKSGTRKELLGRLSTASLAQDYGYVGDMLDKGPDMLNEIAALMEKSGEKTQELSRTISKAGDDNTVSPEEMKDICGRFLDLITEKDEINDKLMAFNKEIVMKAAEVQRKNKAYQEIRAAVDADEWNAQVDYARLKILEKQVDAYEEMVATYKKVMASDEKVIADDEALIANQEELLNSQAKIIIELLAQLSRHEDVSMWNDVHTACLSRVKRAQAEKQDAGENE